MCCALPTDFEERIERIVSAESVPACELWLAKHFMLHDRERIESLVIRSIRSNNPLGCKQELSELNKDEKFCAYPER